MFGEQVRGGPILLLALLPAAALIGAVIMLSRSPTLQAAAGADESAGSSGEGKASTVDEAGERARAASEQDSKLTGGGCPQAAMRSPHRPPSVPLTPRALGLPVAEQRSLTQLPVNTAAQRPGT